MYYLSMFQITGSRMLLQQFFLLLRTAKFLGIFLRYEKNIFSFTYFIVNPCIIFI